MRLESDSIAVDAGVRRFFGNHGNFPKLKVVFFFFVFIVEGEGEVGVAPLLHWLPLPRNTGRIGGGISRQFGCSSSGGFGL